MAEQPPLQGERQQAACQIVQQIPRVAHGGGLIQQGGQLQKEAAGQQIPGGGRNRAYGGHPPQSEKKLHQGQQQGPGQKVAEVPGQEEAEGTGGGGEKPQLVAGVEQDGGPDHPRGEGELAL